jgi:2'-5' RNA ligase
MPGKSRQPALALAQAPAAAPREHVVAALPTSAVRLFVAIAPPAEVLDELEALAAPLRAARTHLRWTSRAAWHVTLAFLGEVEETTLGKLLPGLEQAAHQHEAISLAFAGAGAFPAAHRANVLWSGLSGDCHALAALAESVAAGAGQAGAAPPDKGRRFQPHLTLARCRLPADVRDLVAELAEFQGKCWHASDIHLVRSNLNGPGRPAPGTQPRYTTVATWPLKPS